MPVCIMAMQKILEAIENFYDGELVNAIYYGYRLDHNSLLFQYVSEMLLSANHCFAVMPDGLDIYASIIDLQCLLLISKVD